MTHDAPEENQEVIDVMPETENSDVARLEAEVRRLEQELRDARAATVANAVGLLRLSELCVVYVGDQPVEAVIARVKSELGDAAADAVERHVYDLSKAPVPHSQREAIKRAFNHGLCRW
ncbi:MAG: hypothetical protein E6Q40_03860 [Cupriavidus sp.]|nr:MAG: hypothetical protein E6Q40_03860 [Cupriavidus sp.]